MDFAKVLIVFCRLPAFILLTAVLFAALFFIKSKIKFLCREHVHTNWQLKIFVWNLTITINIKLCKNFVKNFLWNCIPPEIKLASKLLLGNFSSFLSIEILKGLSDSFPLELDFFKNLLLHVSYKECLCCLILVVSFSLLLPLKLHVIIWILGAIMPKIKPRTAMNSTPEPFWKVGVIYFALLLLIMIYHQFD